MKTKPAATTLFRASILAVAGLGSASVPAANTLEVAGGFYSLTGKTKTSSGSKSGIGSYRLGYRRSVSSHVDLGIGYNLTYSSIVSGDAAYGLDVGVTYFPLTASGLQSFEANGQRLQLEADFRPYVSFAFNQRNIQSVQTGYAGFSLGVGAEKTLSGPASLTGTIRYTTLSGSKSATATIIDVLVGLAWGF